jgi:phage N-6-adenine-methyltransferase
MSGSHRGKAATEASRDDWQTPGTLLAGLRQRWMFALDAACSVENAVSYRGLTGEPGFDALASDWRPLSGIRTGRPLPSPAPGCWAVWCNPPFGRRGEMVRAFVARAAQQARDVCGPMGLDVVMLAPGTPGVRWVHDHALGGPRPVDEVWMVDGRVAFVHPDTGQPVPGNPVGSMLLVWRAGWRRPGAPMVGSLGRNGTPRGGWETQA